MTPDPVGLLFVYGTLRSDAPVRAPAAVKDGWTFVGRGTVSGQLYDLGPHPGATPTDDPTARVVGEVYRLPDPERTLPRLDGYEGCGPDDEPPFAFERETVEVALDSAPDTPDRVVAWIYWYTAEAVGIRLTSGDYARSDST